MENVLFLQRVFVMCDCVAIYIKNAGYKTIHGIKLLNRAGFIFEFFFFGVMIFANVDWRDDVTD